MQLIATKSSMAFNAFGWKIASDVRFIFILFFLKVLKHVATLEK